MSDDLPYASENHPIWSPLASDIHSVVWDRVRLEKVRAHVRQWAAEWQHANTEYESRLAEWRGTVAASYPKLVGKGASYPEFVGDVVDKQSKKSLGLPPKKRVLLQRRILPDWPVLQSHEPELPLPPGHRSLSPTEKWAGLAAIHDFYWMDGDKINPWPVPNTKDIEAPSTEDIKAWTEWANGGGFAYRELLQQAGKLTGSADVLVRWLNDLATGLVSDESKTPAAVLGSTAAGRGVAPRNEWSLEQWETRGAATYRKPSKVCAKWNAMKLSEREAICPDRPEMVLLSAVARGITRARHARDGKPSNRPTKRKRTAHKS